MSGLSFPSFSVESFLKPPLSSRLEYSVVIGVQHSIALFGLHALFWLLGEKVKLLEKYRIQKPPHKDQTRPKWSKVVRVVLFNHFLFTIAMYVFIWPLLSRGVVKGKQNFRLTTAIWQFILCFLCEDTMFYWAHRTLHHRRIYKYIHKLHHEFRRPYVLNAEYAHPIEFVFGNVTPSYAGIALCTGLGLGGGMHEITMSLWLAYRILETVDGHCGFDLPFNIFKLIPFHPGAKPHDYHHSHNVGNFGSQLFFWDKLCKTFRGTIDNPVRSTNEKSPNKKSSTPTTQNEENKVDGKSD